MTRTQSSGHKRPIGPEANTELGMADEAKIAYTYALSLCNEPLIPDYSKSLAEQGKWPELQEEYLRAEKAAWMSLEDWRRYAIACRKAGDVANYNRICELLRASTNTANYPSVQKQLESISGKVPIPNNDDIWTRWERELRLE